MKRHLKYQEEILDLSLETTEVNIKNRSSLVDLLGEEEEIVWQSKPDPALLKTKGTKKRALGLAGLLLSGFLFFYSFPVILFWISLVLFAIGVVEGVYGYLYRKQRIDRVAYFCTNNRFVFKHGISKKPYWSIPFEEIEHIRYRKEEDGNEVISFMLKKGINPGFKTPNLKNRVTRKYPTIELVSNTEKVHHELHSLWQSHLKGQEVS